METATSTRDLSTMKRRHEDDDLPSRRVRQRNDSDDDKIKLEATELADCISRDIGWAYHPKDGTRVEVHWEVLGE